MREIRIAAAQFEHRDGDKAFNLQRIDDLVAGAVALGGEVVSFHEGSITGYSYLQSATRDELMEVAEEVPGGPSCKALGEISARHGVPVLAGLVERDGEDLYNASVCFDADGLPVGLQLVARSFAEETLFSLATAFEEHDPELDRRPSR